MTQKTNKGYKMQKKFLGFGFGAIQGGLFLYEAFQSGNFDELTVAEVMPEVVRDLREAGGVYRVNVAGRSGIVRHEVRGVAVWNSRVEADRAKLVAAVAEADEIVTALPSVDFYGEDAPDSVVSILAEGLRLRSGAASRPDCDLYGGKQQSCGGNPVGTLERQLRCGGMGCRACAMPQYRDRQDERGGDGCGANPRSGVGAIDAEFGALPAGGGV